MSSYPLPTTPGLSRETKLGLAFVGFVVILTIIGLVIYGIKRSIGSATTNGTYTPGGVSSNTYPSSLQAEREKQKKREGFTAKMKDWMGM